MWAQWVLGKIWELIMRFLPHRKSAVEMLAAMQLQEREIENKLSTYIPQLEFAFRQLAHEHPAANALPVAGVAKALDVTPERAEEIVRVLVKQKRLEPLRSHGAQGETLYMLTPPVIRPRLFRL